VENVNEVNPAYTFEKSMCWGELRINYELKIKRQYCIYFALSFMLLALSLLKGE